MVCAASVSSLSSVYAENCCGPTTERCGTMFKLDNIRYTQWCTEDLSLISQVRIKSIINSVMYSKSLMQYVQRNMWSTVSNAAPKSISISTDNCLVNGLNDIGVYHNLPENYIISLMGSLHMEHNLHNSITSEWNGRGPTHLVKFMFAQFQCNDKINNRFPKNKLYF